IFLPNPSLLLFSILFSFDSIHFRWFLFRFLPFLLLLLLLELLFLPHISHPTTILSFSFLFHGSDISILLHIHFDRLHILVESVLIFSLESSFFFLLSLSLPFFLVFLRFLYIQSVLFSFPDFYYPRL